MQPHHRGCPRTQVRWQKIRLLSESADEGHLPGLHLPDDSDAADLMREHPHRIPDEGCTGIGQHGGQPLSLLHEIGPDVLKRSPNRLGIGFSYGKGNRLDNLFTDSVRL